MSKNDGLPNHHFARIALQRTCKNIQNRRFARAILPNNAHTLFSFKLIRKILN